MERTRRGVTAIILLAVCLSLYGAAHGDVAGQTTTASGHVPLKANWRMYATRGPATFNVPRCAHNALARLVPQTAQAAAEAWNRAAEHTLISVRPTACTSETFRDRRNAIYAVDGLESQRLGSHLSLMSGPNGRLIEQDIQLAWPQLADDVQGAPDSGRSVVYNVLLHEMGHALGLGHVTARSGNCDLSVMREQICRMAVRKTPTSADVAALRRVYDLSSTSGGRASSTVADDALARYDANDNGRIDDAEFMTVLDRWVQNELSTPTFHQLLEAWAQGARLRAQTDSAPRQFIRVFDLDGRPVLTQACSPQALTRVQNRLSQRAIGPETYVVRTRECRSGATSTRLIAIAPH